MENIINKYLNHSATETEKKQLLQWLEEKEENRRSFKKTYDLWLHTDASLTDDIEVEKAFSRLKRRILSSRNKKRMLFESRHLVRIAVAALLLFSAGYVGYMMRGKQNSQAITFYQLLTGTNGKGEYRLPDGSIVWLNANSMLKYPQTFTGKKREVYLEGEALFEVQKNADNPFVVKTGGMNIEVLGTRFLVNNHPQKNIVETVLINGCVEVSGDYFNKTQRMQPGEIITYNKQTQVINRSNVNANDYTNWIHSKLVFDKTNLEQVIINLEKWFGVEIIASPELIRNTHMSFTIRRESLDEVLTYMSLTASIDYTWEGDVLRLLQKK